MAEAAEDGFRGAGGGAVVREGGDVGAGCVAGGAGARCVVEEGVFVLGGGGIAVGGVVGAVPVMLPGGGGFEEDLVAVGAGGVVTEAEVLVKEQGAGGDGLVAVGADFFVRGGGGFQLWGEGPRRRQGGGDAEAVGDGLARLRW